MCVCVCVLQSVMALMSLCVILPGKTPAHDGVAGGCHTHTHTHTYTDPQCDLRICLRSVFMLLCAQVPDPTQSRPAASTHRSAPRPGTLHALCAPFSLLISLVYPLFACMCLCMRMNMCCVCLCVCVCVGHRPGAAVDDQQREATSVLT